MQASFLLHCSWEKATKVSSKAAATSLPFFAHSQPDGDSPLPMTNDSGGDKEPVTQSSDRDGFQSSQLALEENDYVVRQNAQAQGRLRSPKIPAGLLRQPIDRLQFFNDVFAGGPAIVLSPDRQRFFCPR
jgi:hypothetical protein